MPLKGRGFHGLKPRGFCEEHIRLTARMIAEARIAFHQQFPNAEFGFDHRFGHVWPLRMMSKSSNTSVLQDCYICTPYYCIFDDFTLL